jgi:transaldolase
MRLYLDTADISEIRWALSTGLIDGVTTDPSLLAAELADREPFTHVGEIADLVDGPVTVQVISIEADGMYREGRELARIADNVVVEIPMIEEGLVATRRLVADGIRVNVNLVFNAAQALLAAKAGASFVSPFIGRLDDTGIDGTGVLADVRTIFDRFGVECEVVAACIRSVHRFLDSARLGADSAAIPPSVLREMMVHPLTDLGLDRFLSDWSKRIAKTRSGA